MKPRARIRSYERQAFLMSLVIHAGAIAFLLLMILVQSLRKETREHVFELVELPQTTASEPTARQSSMEPEPTLERELPELKPLVEPPPRRPVPVREPQPRPEPDPEPEIITADQFRREFGEPERRTRPVPRPQLEVPRIDTSRLQEELQSMVVSTSRQNVSAMSSANQDALNSYISALRSRINTVWEKPPGYSGDTREVVVVFHVGPDGRITRVRLESGNAGDPFARSVLQAFDRVTPVGPTPERQAYTFRMPFRMVER